MSGAARLFGRRGSWRRRARVRQLRRLAPIVVPAFATGFLAVVIIADRAQPSRPGLEVGVGATRIDPLPDGTAEEISLVSRGDVATDAAAPIAPSPPPTEAADAASPEAAEAVALAAPSPPPTDTSPTAAAPAVEVKRRVQLAALKNERDARQAWARLRKAQGDLLGRFDPVFQPPDARAKLWRIQVGADSDAEARRLCVEMKRRGLGCFVVSEKLQSGR